MRKFGFACVILGAGGGSRFGEPKAGALLRPGVRFIDAVIATARDAEADPIIAVVPPGLHVPAAARRVENPRSLGEPITSVRLGLAALANSMVNGVLLWPVDHPFVLVETVLALIDAHRRTGAPVLLPTCDQRRGHPVFFARTVWGELMAVGEGEGGARTIVRRYEQDGDLAEVAVPDDGVLRNIDTRADLEIGPSRRGNAIPGVG